MRAAVERRWFALHRAAERLQQECASLAEVLQATQSAWRNARYRLSELEALRDALGEELSSQDTFRHITSDDAPAARATGMPAPI
jgi:hypothetical protein